MTPLPETEQAKFSVLATSLAAAHKVATRLVTSIKRVDGIFPLTAEGMNELDDEEEEKIDAFLFRFSSLSGMIQDQLTRSILEFEEEDPKEKTRRSVRLLMEELGAFKPEHNLGVVGELRNKLVHTYPEAPGRQAEILNAVYDKAEGLVEAYNTVLDYAAGRKPELVGDLGYVRLSLEETEEADPVPSVTATTLDP